VAVLETLLRHLHDHYVFPEVAAQIEEQIRPKLGEYAAIASPAELADRLTADLQAITRDKHLRVFYSEKPLPPRPPEPTPEQIREWDLQILLANGGFHRVERLKGNVGYLDLKGFAPAEVAGETAAAAMAFLAGTEALIIDLRANEGGNPSMVALLCSYFLRHRTHLNSLYWRDQDRTEQFWTLPHVPGKRYLEKPLYLLTSTDTFSAAEEFCYNLQALKRATIVGERTGGGAHPGRILPLTDHLEVFVPAGRAIHPITGTNWEGRGVIPEIAVPAEQAYATAYAEALKHVIARAEQESAAPWHRLRQEAAKALAELAVGQP